LRDGVTLAQANEEMNAIARPLAEQYPDTNSNYGVTIVPFHEHLVGNRLRLPGEARRHSFRQ